MGTDSAYLNKARRIRALSCHRHQASLLTKAVVSSQLYGALTERSRFGKACQGDHLRNVFEAKLLEMPAML